jgi:type II secretory pathway pseudopilin PulG
VKSQACLAAGRRARRRQAGFTLVELMVALTGGLFISLAVFGLARDSGRFYQRESRVANATIGALLGFERLRTDIARAGFLASPNISRDPSVCVPPNASWPLALRSLASIQITPGTAAGGLAANGRNPPTLLLAGSYTSSDIFPARVVNNVNNVQFFLIPGSPALTRLGNGANPDNATLGSVFNQARALRFVQYGKQYYGQIIAANGGPAPSVTVNTAPPIQFRSGAAGGCGAEIVGSGAGEGTINVVNFIQYSLRNLSATPLVQPPAQTPSAVTNYASLYAGSAKGPGEADRTELVRVEQNVAGAAIDTTEEIVAEYAVDLGFQLTAVTNIVGCCNPTVTFVPTSATAFATFTGNVYNSTVTPEKIRSVRVRLGVRSRESDRPSDINADTGDPTVGLYRFNLGAGAATGADTFARVRTFQADVALYNQMDVLW